jgi:hypothetical protein
VLDQGLGSNLDGIDEGRREVIDRLVSGSAFVPPTVVGFGMGHSTKSAYELGPRPSNLS